MIAPRRQTALALMLVFAVAAGGEDTARAQDVPPAPPAPPDTPNTPEAATDPRLEEAKALFRQGNELRKVGDLQGALQRYQRSRALVKSLPNTMNAAICLEQLGRLDEALELYEHVVADFAPEITAQVRDELAGTMGSLRRQVGSVDVSANVDGVVVVDGRMREHLPLLAPLRALPGARRVVIIKEGYEPFEKKVTITAGQSTIVEARLRPLGAAGRLHVAAAGLEGGQLQVDGAVIGTLPWDGSLSPGAHVVSVEKEDLGTAPRTVTVIEGQLVHIALQPVVIGAELRVSTTPATAEILVDGVHVGRGTWNGRLPLGAMAIEAREIGYQPTRVLAPISARRMAPLQLELRIDESHPRWRRPSEGRFFVEALGGPAFSGSLGTGAEQACDSIGCSERSAVVGAMAAARAGYELDNRLSIALAIGFLRAGTDLARSYGARYRADDPSTPVQDDKAVTYEIADSLVLSGPFLLGGAGYRVPLGDRLDLGLRLEAGAMLATASDTFAGRISDGSGRSELVDVTVTGEDGNQATSVTPLVVPQIGLSLRLGRLRVGAGVAMIAGLGEGPALQTGETQVRAETPCDGDPGSLSCAPRERFVAGERAFGRFLLWVPNLGARLDL